MDKKEKLIIIGSGPAGLTAGIYGGRAEIEPLLFAGESYGGQLMLTTIVDNFPGFPEGIMGPELMQNMIKQTERFGAKVLYKYATKVDFSSKPYKVYSGEEVYYADSVIIATGAKPKWLGLPMEMELVGRGLSTCATCDAAFYRGKIVGVVGGGDTAMEEAAFLSKFAKEVKIIHRRSEFRASKAMQQRVFDIKNISVIWESEIVSYIQKEIGGEKYLEGINIKNAKTGNISKELFDGVFLAIGHEPLTEIFEAIDKDENGYIKPLSGSTVKTNVDGVFVCGDAEDHRYRQAIVAAGSGCMAAMEAEAYISRL